jgi:hypothetical protein
MTGGVGNLFKPPIQFSLTSYLLNPFLETTSSVHSKDLNIRKFCLLTPDSQNLTGLIRGLKFTVETKVADPHHFNEDPISLGYGSDFSHHADPDPSHHQSDTNLRALVFRPLRLHFEPPRPSNFPL